MLEVLILDRHPHFLLLAGGDSMCPGVPFGEQHLPMHAVRQRIGMRLFSPLAVLIRCLRRTNLRVRPRVGRRNSVNIGSTL